MKKTMTVLSIFALSACLVACSDEDKKPKEQEGTETKQVTENKTISIEAFLALVEKAPMELNSFATETAITTTTTVNGKEEIMPMNISLKATLVPLRIKQYIDMDLRENGLGRIKGVSYMQDGFMYVEHPVTGEWIKEAIPNFEDTAKQSLTQSPAEQVALIKQYAHLFTVKETNEHYLLRFKGAKKDIQEVIDGQLKSILKNNTLPISSDNKWSYEKLTYQITLDKKNFYPVSLDMTTKLMASIDGQDVQTNLTMKATYKDINAVEAIELPAEAQNAKNAGE